MKTKPETQRVIFRASRRKNPEISAILVGQHGSYKNPLVVWDSSCGHGDGSMLWYRTTRPAKPDEYARELRKLQAQYAPEYVLKVVQKLPSRR